MKRIVSLICLCSLLLFAVNADVRIPSSVFNMEELEEAKAEAFEEKKPLIFVYTDPGTS